MTNITLAMDDKFLKKVRGYAKRNGTTVNSLVRRTLGDLLQSEAGREDARRKLRELMDSSEARLPPGWKFDRNKLYDSPSLSDGLPDEVKEAAQAYAAERNTTVEALIHEYLVNITLRRKRAKEAMAELRKMSETTKADLGPDWKFDRESIYER
jgi:hypothetical protein